MYVLPRDTFFGIRFSGIPVFGIHFLGTHFFGIHFRNPAFWNPFFGIRFFSFFSFFFVFFFHFFGIDFRHLGKNEKNENFEKWSCVLLVWKQWRFRSSFFSEPPISAFLIFFELWGGSRLHPISWGWFGGVGGWQLNWVWLGFGDFDREC